MDYWDAVQRYEKARNRLASERLYYGHYGDLSEAFALDRGTTKWTHAPRVVEVQELSGIKAQHIFS
jgi:hypothetical protein